MNILCSLASVSNGTWYTRDIIYILSLVHKALQFKARFITKFWPRANLFFFSLNKITNMFPFYYMIFLVPEQINNTKKKKQKITANKINGRDYLHPTLRTCLHLEGIQAEHYSKLTGNCWTGILKCHSGFGILWNRTCSFRITQTPYPVTPFVKNDPDTITWPSNLCSPLL